MRVKQWLIDQAFKREPDVIIGGQENPYMKRWWLIPRNRFFNIYLHHFLRSDDDRALHDHPWLNISWLLTGQYLEHRILAGGIHQKNEYQADDCIVRLSGAYSHRIELHKGPVWTLFITGPVYRKWGFHCPDAGWVYYRDFVTADDEGAIGKGCDQ